MSVNNQNDPQDQEIDLGMVLKKISNFLDGVAMAIFKGILFIKKKSLILVSLTLIGTGLGFYLDSTSYNHEIIVAPNMGGTDYLYSKIKLISSKLKEHDLQFFNSIGIKNPKEIVQIEIAPIIDINGFINNNSAVASNNRNFELIKLLSEGSDIDEVIKDEIISKNYPHHKIQIVTNSKTSSKELIQPLLKYINTDRYLNEILTISRENIKIKMVKNEELIIQADSLIKILTLNLSRNQKNSNLVYNNENNQFNALFDLKNSLINEIASQRITLANCDVAIKDIFTIVNIKKTQKINENFKFVLPIVFIFLYIFYSLFLAFYRTQARKLTLSR
jgi:hypothetical protein